MTTATRTSKAKSSASKAPAEKVAEAVTQFSSGLPARQQHKKAAYVDENTRQPREEVEDDPKALQATIAALKARLEREASAKRAAEERARRALQERPPPQQTKQKELSVEVIEQPSGKAGSKNGYRIIEAMGLDGDEKSRAMYRNIQNEVREACVKASIGRTAKYHNVDVSKLSKVYCAVRAEFPYLTRRRFPRDWAIAEITKQYLQNRRNYDSRKSRGKAGKRKAPASSDNEEDGPPPPKKSQSAASPDSDKEEDEDEEVSGEPSGADDGEGGSDGGMDEY